MLGSSRSFAHRLEHLLELAHGVVYLSIQVHATGPAPKPDDKTHKSPFGGDFPSSDVADWPSSGKSAASHKSGKSSAPSPTSTARLTKMMPLAHVNEGRPDIAKMLDALVDALVGPKDVWHGTPIRCATLSCARADTLSGGICVVACGPMPMVFSARKAVSSIARAKPVQAGGIVMHSEAFAG